MSSMITVHKHFAPVCTLTIDKYMLFCAKAAGWYHAV